MSRKVDTPTPRGKSRGPHARQFEELKRRMRLLPAELAPRFAKATTAAAVGRIWAAAVKRACKNLPSTKR